MSKDEGEFYARIFDPGSDFIKELQLAELQIAERVGRCPLVVATRFHDNDQWARSAICNSAILLVTILLLNRPLVSLVATKSHSIRKNYIFTEYFESSYYFRRQGKEVVRRKDILPMYTERWIRFENLEFHSSVDKNTFDREHVIKFLPPDGCFFEVRFFSAIHSNNFWRTKIN